VYVVTTGDSESYARGYFEWFVDRHPPSGESVSWRWNNVTPEAFLDSGGISRVAAGSIVLVQSYHLRERDDMEFLAGTLPERPRLLRAPKLWAILNATEPLIVILNNDGDCSLELPSTSHHVFYRDTWSDGLHHEYLRSRALEPGGPERGWPWLRSFPFGTPFDGGDLSKLESAAALPADRRKLLFAFRGTRGWSKPSRQQLDDAEARGRTHWTDLSARLMAHAPPLGAKWPRRYIVDLKSVEYMQDAQGNWSRRDLTSYQSEANFSYVDTLRDAAFTLSPPGDLWEAYRTWEAMEAGSIPVVADNASYKLEGCARPALHLQETAPFVLSVRSWDELPAVLERAAPNASALLARQAEMARWLKRRKAEVRAEILATSRAMADSSSLPERWRARTVCRAVPLSPSQVGAQQRALAAFWRRPQNQSVGGPWFDGWSAESDGNKGMLFTGADGMCEVPPHGARSPDDFTEKCKVNGCAPPLIAALECAPR
tara:strand:- start:2057 stop:3517 length:1461 start_codon:yes stop_codon:yes gene_type:complete